MNIKMEDNVRMKNGITVDVANVFDDHFTDRDGHKHMFVDVDMVNGSTFIKPVVEDELEMKDDLIPVKKESVKGDGKVEETKPKSIKVEETKSKEKTIGIDLDTDVGVEETKPEPVKVEKTKSTRKSKEKKIGIDLDNDGKVDVEVDASVVEEDKPDAK